MEKQKPPFKKNDLIPLTIEDFSSDGAGIGRYQGLCVFVPRSAPGDRLCVRILKVAKRYAFGKIESIQKSASIRISPDCPVYAKCGGCCFRHISYESELIYKEKRLKDALTRIGGFTDIPVDKIVGAAQRNRYRNKCLLPIGRDSAGCVQMGFYALHSHRIVDCTDCLLQPEAFSRIARTVRAFLTDFQISIYDEATHTGLVRRLFLRSADRTGELMVCVVINGEALPHEQRLVQMLQAAAQGIVSIVINQNTKKTNVALGETNRVLYGTDKIHDILCGLRFSISPLSFYQVNRTQAERLYQKAAEYAQLTREDVLLDLYCGTGTIGLSMAAKAKQLIGVEAVPDAVENARENARQNGIENAVFYCADAAELQQYADIKPSVVVIDPPRKGCSPEVIRLICGYAPKRLVYISCDPATLARDLKLFSQEGFQVTAAAAFDLFPGTAHVETVALLSPQKPQQGSA